MPQIKPENVVLVFTDGNTGKPYARQLSAWESRLVMAQMAALDGDELKAVEIAPFIMRSADLSEEEAQRIAEEQRRRSRRPDHH